MHENLRIAILSFAPASQSCTNKVALPNDAASDSFALIV